MTPPDTRPGFTAADHAAYAAFLARHGETPETADLTIGDFVLSQEWIDSPRPVVVGAKVDESDIPY